MERKDLEERSVMDYRKSVRESKRRIKDGMSDAQIMKMQKEAAE